MIKHLSEEEKTILQDAFRKGIESGSLPLVIDEGDIPDDMVPVYCNDAALKKISRMKSYSVGPSTKNSN